MIFKDFIFGIVQRTLSNQQKISRVFFVFSGPGHLAVRRGGMLQPWPADAFLSRDRHLKSFKTHPEDAPQHAVAGGRLAIARRPQAISLTSRTFLHGERQDVRLVPLHFFSFTFFILRSLFRTVSLI